MSYANILVFAIVAIVGVMLAGGIVTGSMRALARIDHEEMWPWPVGFLVAAVLAILFMVAVSGR